MAKFPEFLQLPHMLQDAPGMVYLPTFGLDQW